MTHTIKTIRLTMPLGMGSVNCYLVRTSTGFVLIDTGAPSNRSQLEGELEKAGCSAGALELIVLTHGDFDHIGNAAYLREKYGASIAMHPNDAGMAERGDMFWNRKNRNVVVGTMARLLVGFGRSRRFVPDFPVTDGQDLSEHGFRARIVQVPGHSSGSIAILTEGGDLFCGDLLENREKPSLHSLVDDPAAMQASVGELIRLGVGMVYPGHGEPFPMETLEVGDPQSS